MEFSDKHPKNRDTKQAYVFTTTVDFFRKIAQYTIQRLNSVLGYKKINL